MSFFEEGDQPRRPARPRSPARPTATVAPDQQTLRVRQGVAAGVVLLVVILLVVGVRGCLDSQKKTSLRDYSRNVSALIQESDQVGQQFFETLAAAGGRGTGANATAANNTNQLEPQLNQLRIQADTLVGRARRQNVPDDVDEAQTNLVLVLELRRDAIGKIAAKLPTARGQSGADQAVNQIAGQMRAFDASDVIYSQRVIPHLKRALDRADLQGQSVPSSQFLPDIAWLQPDQVTRRIGATAQAARQGPAAPGSHGHGLDAVSVGNTDLRESGGNRLTAGSNVVFTVRFSNQAENDESNVNVKVTIEGSGRPITVTKPVPQSPAGETTTTEVPLGQAPPIGKPVTITVEVQPVPGEADAANNRKTYQAFFSA